MFWNKKRIFLDFASTTPVSREVVLAMSKCEKVFANPSALYSEAMVAKDMLDNAKKRIAKVLNADKQGIVFTSGGTESNNLALLGVFEKSKNKFSKPHFISSVIEHPSILEVLKEIERRGGEVTLLPVGETGIVNPKDVLSAIKPSTVLVSIMYANNEIGTIQPIREIAKLTKDYRNKSETEYPYLHTDASQAGLYLPLNIMEAGVHMMTLDGIKMYGPRGTGILYVRSDVDIIPVLFGGGQENGIRSGTENLTNAVGFATALEIADSLRERESKRLQEIRDYGISLIKSSFPSAHLNGSEKYRLPNNINFCFPKLSAEFAVIALDLKGISASYSSSCRTLKEDSSSYVVESLGDVSCGESSLRFTLGRETKKKDMDILLNALKQIIK